MRAVDTKYRTEALPPSDSIVSCTGRHSLALSVVGFCLDVLCRLTTQIVTYECHIFPTTTCRVVNTLRAPFSTSHGWLKSDKKAEACPPLIPAPPRCLHRLYIYFFFPPNNKKRNFNFAPPLFKFDDDVESHLLACSPHSPHGTSPRAHRQAPGRSPHQ